MPDTTGDAEHQYLLKHINLAELSNNLVFAHSPADMVTQGRGLYDIYPVHLVVDYGIFTNSHPVFGFQRVTVAQHTDGVTLTCACGKKATRLCQHQAQVLFFIMNKKEVRLFFDRSRRRDYILHAAVDYGLQQEPYPEEYFDLRYEHPTIRLAPRLHKLLATGEAGTAYLNEQLPSPARALTKEASPKDLQTILVLSNHKYQPQLVATLWQTQIAANGKLKGRLSPVATDALTWTTNDAKTLKFYAALQQLARNTAEPAADDADALHCLVHNAPGFPVYFKAGTEDVTTTGLQPVQLNTKGVALSLTLKLKAHFYELSLYADIAGSRSPVQQLERKFHRFFLLKDKLYFISDPYQVQVLDFFGRHGNQLLVHESKYAWLRDNLLNRLEQKITIRQPQLKKAPLHVLEVQGFTSTEERIIYLSDSGPHIIITPVMRYGDVEIAVLSKKQIIAEDRQGKRYTVPRNDVAELQFIAALTRQHPHFAEQLELGYFYLHKERFLAEDWFPDAFDTWRRDGIRIMGFETLTNNRLNAHKAKVSVQVSSGINWFNTALNVQYGKQRASLKQLQKAIKSKSRYVQLDDGSLGIMPEDWIARFQAYFNAGDITNEDLRTYKINFGDIEAAYEAAEFTAAAKQEIDLYKTRLAGFSAIASISAPEGLMTTLRGYQQQGLEWLNFLDDFNFGACLADDMGLGKTIQVIAFLLRQRSKRGAVTNLIVVPTSLIFNWQQELARFAPELNVHTLHGAGRLKSTAPFAANDVVLTAYGTMVADIALLKRYTFNYIVLDESQAIKNPGSQRYQAACSLKARNRIVLSGTPVENNTFDLYGQLSFACPGLLGSRQQFRDLYAIPVDKFKNSKRAAELQRKVQPFILRRTKAQVAPELPEKTEMILYCDMSEHQRKIYKEEERKIKEYISEQDEEQLHKNSMHILKGLTKLRQLCNSTDVYEDGKLTRQDSAKMDALMDAILQQSGNHKILVFSQFVTMLDHIKHRLDTEGIRYAYLSGKTKNREAAVTRFRNDKNVSVFLISLKAGGTGLNLTEADYVYLVEPWWNPAVEQQAIDRSHRIGQDKQVIAVRLICPDTIEEKIIQLQETKKQLVSDLISTDHNGFKDLRKSDLLNLLG